MPQALTECLLHELGREWKAWTSIHPHTAEKPTANISSPQQGIRVQVSEGRLQDVSVCKRSSPLGPISVSVSGDWSKGSSCWPVGYLYHVTCARPFSLPSEHYLLFRRTWAPSAKKSLHVHSSPLPIKTHNFLNLLFVFLLKGKRQPLFIFCGLFEYNAIGGLVTGNIFLADLFCYVSILPCAQPRRLRKQMLPALRKLEEEIFSEPAAWCDQCSLQWDMTPESKAAEATSAWLSSQCYCVTCFLF